MEVVEEAGVCKSQYLNLENSIYLGTRLVSTIEFLRPIYSLGLWTSVRYRHTLHPGGQRKPICLPVYGIGLSPRVLGPSKLMHLRCCGCCWCACSSGFLVELKIISQIRLIEPIRARKPLFLSASL